MKSSEPKIAIVTVSGKAYYQLVKEFRRRRTPFLSLAPGDHIPFSIKVIITTDENQRSIEHAKVLIYQEDAVPTTTVDQAVRLARGKQGYDKAIIGIDPGKTFGVAAIVDGRLFGTASCLDHEEVVDIVIRLLNRASARVNIVKIGSGAPAHAEQLANSLDLSLPNKVILETVSEVRTSHPVKKHAYQRESRDVLSAIEITKRTGRALQRGKLQSGAQG